MAVWSKLKIIFVVDVECSCALHATVEHVHIRPTNVSPLKTLEQQNKMVHLIALRVRMLASDPPCHATTLCPRRAITLRQTILFSALSRMILFFGCRSPPRHLKRVQDSSLSSSSTRRFDSSPWRRGPRRRTTV